MCVETEQSCTVMTAPTSRRASRHCPSLSGLLMTPVKTSVLEFFHFNTPSNVDIVTMSRSLPAWPWLQLSGGSLCSTDPLVRLGKETAHRKMGDWIKGRKKKRVDNNERTFQLSSFPQLYCLKILGQYTAH